MCSESVHIEKKKELFFFKFVLIFLDGLFLGNNLHKLNGNTDQAEPKENKRLFNKGAKAKLYASFILRSFIMSYIFSDREKLVREQKASETAQKKDGIVHAVYVTKLV